MVLISIGVRIILRLCSCRRRVRPRQACLPFQIKGLKLLEAMCKKAEKEDMQDAGAVCMYQMTTAMRKVQFANAREVIDGLTNSGIAAFKSETWKSIIATTR